MGHIARVAIIHGCTGLPSKHDAPSPPFVGTGKTTPLPAKSRRNWGIVRSENARAGHQRTPSMPQTSPIEINTENFYRSANTRQGVDRSEFEALSARLTEIAQTVDNGSHDGLEANYACLTLGQTMAAQVPAINEAAASLASFRDIVLIGIGGSSLGAKAILQAIAPNTSPHPSGRLHFVENVDPYALQRILSRLEAAQTAVLCISKSGGTIETVVQYLILREWLNQKLGIERARQHQWIVTDPNSGWLRELAASEKLPSLPVPQRVGGRY